MIVLMNIIKGNRTIIKDFSSCIDGYVMGARAAM